MWQQGALGKDSQQLASFLAQFRIADAGTAARGINDAVPFGRESLARTEPFDIKSLRRLTYAAARPVRTC